MFGFHAYAVGDELGTLEQSMGEYNDFLRQSKQALYLSWNNVYRQTVLCLAGKTADPRYLSSEDYDEELAISTFEEIII